MADEITKISSVTELSKYRVGDTVFWVVMRQKTLESGPRGEPWMLDYHPKVYFQRGYRASWSKQCQLPKLHATDFSALMSLLTTRLVVLEFEIAAVTRSSDTGEFLYQNNLLEWMPEEFLFPTKELAAQERRRLHRLVQKWIEN